LVLSIGLRRKTLGKKFNLASGKVVCPNIKRITLGKVLWSLEDMAPHVTAHEETRRKAKLAVDRILETGRNGTISKEVNFESKGR
jgi:quinolinate synthase